METFFKMKLTTSLVDFERKNLYQEEKP